MIEFPLYSKRSRDHTDIRGQPALFDFLSFAIAVSNLLTIELYSLLFRFHTSSLEINACPGHSRQEKVVNQTVRQSTN